MYNHCTGHRGKFPERYAREENLTICFGERLRELVIGPEILAWLPDELLASDLTEQAARDQALRRHQAELDRLPRRLDTLYDDRLDGRIDGDRYDQKADEIHEEQPRIRAQVSESGGALPPAKAAVNLLALTSRAADLFMGQSAAEQRKLLRLVLGEAIWQAGELRMSFQTPFEELRLSNSTSAIKHTPEMCGGTFFDNWR